MQGGEGTGLCIQVTFNGGLSELFHPNRFITLLSFTKPYLCLEGVTNRKRRGSTPTVLTPQQQDHQSPVELKVL